MLGCRNVHAVGLWCVWSTEESSHSRPGIVSSMFIGVLQCPLALHPLVWYFQEVVFRDTTVRRVQYLAIAFLRVSTNILRDLIGLETSLNKRVKRKGHVYGRVWNPRRDVYYFLRASTNPWGGDSSVIGVVPIKKFGTVVHNALMTVVAVMRLHTNRQAATCPRSAVALLQLGILSSSFKPGLRNSFNVDVGDGHNRLRVFPVGWCKA